ncbi:tetraspanin-33-like [Dermacentor albipictus]|uniref:tetraspanin-33-like n=1 Tax=Dermacentor albipictus TaxID=60249 RepID=UPI0038FC8670
MARNRDDSTIIIDVNPMHRIPLIIINVVVFAFCSIVVFASIYSIVERYGEISFLHRSLIISFVVNIEVSALFASGLLHVISFMGLIGALRENVCLLNWYLWGMCLLLTLDLTFIVGCLVVPFLSRGSAQSVFNIDLVTSYRDNSDYTRLVDYTQESFECCGVTEGRFRDWDHNIYFNCSKSNPSSERCSVPSSCCRRRAVRNVTGQEGKVERGEDPEERLKRRFCGRGVLNISEQDAWKKVYTRSCVDACVSYIRSNISVMCGVALVVFAVLTLLRSMAITVHDEIISLTELYDKYYRNKARGYRKSLARRRAMLLEATAMNLVVTRTTQAQ